MGILAYQAKDYVAADDWLKRATTASPEYQPAHYYLGLTLARLHDKEGSERELKAAVDLAKEQQGRSAPLPADAPP
jgi:Flp pilus assembly protein TadD